MRRRVLGLLPAALLLLLASATATACAASRPTTQPSSPAPPAPSTGSLAIPEATASVAGVAAPDTTGTPGAATPPGSAPLGQLDFPVTGSDECQRHFREGMLALHSFLYDQAHVSFGAAIAADPRCAMAAWGDAMAYDRALWYEQDFVKGRAALAAVTREDALTPKERAFLAVARALYAKDSIKEAHETWLAAAAVMHRDYPDDDEVILQHALALLSVYGGDGSHVRQQMEAGALALQVFAHNPQHPGAAHYVIHAFDSREHAVLALPAAQAYARIAPAASHALHMPSHVFTRLGMWRDVVPSNERAYAASVAWETSRGHTPSAYDWHAYAWLVAAHLELGQRAVARKLTDDAAALLAAAKDDSSDLRFNYVLMVGNYVSQTGRWDELEGMIAPVLAPAFDERPTAGRVAWRARCTRLAAAGDPAPERGPRASPRGRPARGGGDPARRRGHAVKRAVELKTVRTQMAPWQTMLSPRFDPVLDARADALLARARAAGSRPAREEGDRRARATRAAGARAGRRGPGDDVTTHELLGEALLAAGNAKDALAQYEQDLDERPNRAIALLGAARAARPAGRPRRRAATTPRWPTCGAKPTRICRASRRQRRALDGAVGGGPRTPGAAASSRRAPAGGTRVLPSRRVRVTRRLPERQDRLGHAPCEVRIGNATLRRIGLDMDRQFDNRLPCAPIEHGTVPLVHRSHCAPLVFARTFGLSPGWRRVRRSRRMTRAKCNASKVRFVVPAIRIHGRACLAW